MSAKLPDDLAQVCRVLLDDPLGATPLATADPRGGSLVGIIDVRVSRSDDLGPDGALGEFSDLTRSYAGKGVVPYTW
jgi:hypothetical protein